MTDISFNCPHCKQNLEAPGDMAGETLACPNCQKAIRIPTVAPITLSAPKGKLAGRLIAGIIGGLILAVLGANIVSMVTGGPMAKEPSKTATAIAAIVFLGLWAASIVVAVRAQRAAKVWRRLLISCACLSLALPLAGFIMAGRTTHHYAAKGAELEAAATAGVGGVMAIFLGILGFFLGAIFLTIGLLVGRDLKEPK